MKYNKKKKIVPQDCSLVTNLFLQNTIESDCICIIQKYTFIFNSKLKIY